MCVCVCGCGGVFLPVTSEAVPSDTAGVATACIQPESQPGNSSECDRSKAAASASAPFQNGPSPQNNKKNIHPLGVNR